MRGNDDVSEIQEMADELSDFLDDYVAANKWFTPEDDRENEDAEDEELTVLMFDAAWDSGGKIHVHFTYGESVDLSKHDPKARAEECMRAANEALPDLARHAIEVTVLDP